MKYVVELTDGKLYGGGELGLKLIVEHVLVAKVRHRRSMLANKQSPSPGGIRETDRADVAFVRKPDVVTCRGRYVLLHSILKSPPMADFAQQQHRANRGTYGFCFKYSNRGAYVILKAE